MSGFRRLVSSTLAVNAVLAVAYYFAAQLGLSLAFVNDSATAFWPCTGLSIASVLFFGRRVWPGIFFGALFINYSVDRQPLVAFGIATGNTLEALFAFWAVNRWATGSKVFERPTDVFRFTIIASLAAAVSAVIGVTSLLVGGFAMPAQFWDVWHTWWLGDFVSALIVAPFLLTWARARTAWREVPGILAVVVTAAVVAQVIFGGWFPGAVKGYPLEYLCIPVVIWAAFAFTHRGAHSVVFVISWLAVRGTLRGYGPFAMGGYPHESLLLLQAFMGTIAVVAMVLAALVSETLKSRADLEKRVDELRTSNLELEQFAHVISHDLQEPIGKIINFGDRLGMKANFSAEEKDYLSRMRAAAGRMKAVLEDLLRFSGITRAADKEIVGLGNVAAEVLSDLELRIAELGAEIEVRPDLPEAYANRLQMRHLLLNFVSNALKFHKPGVRPRIVIGGGPLPEGGAEFFVADEGIGFDERYARKIFEPFQRLHARGQYEGTGIGLSIVQKIVQNHGGTIAVRSEPSNGAKFTVKLPPKPKN